MHHTFFVHFFAVVARLRTTWKWLISRLWRTSTQENDFLFLSLNWIQSFRIQLRKISPTIDGPVEQDRINPTKLNQRSDTFVAAIMMMMMMMMMMILMITITIIIITIKIIIINNNNNNCYWGRQYISCHNLLVTNYVNNALMLHTVLHISYRHKPSPDFELRSVSNRVLLSGFSAWVCFAGNMCHGVLFFHDGEL